jgi:hypothetical protein
MAAITNAERARRDRLYREGKKDCSSCLRQKPLADFSRRADCWRGLAPECRRCVHARGYADRIRNPDREAARQRRWRRENRPARLAIEQRYAASRRRRAS